ncbi:MAG TPA: ABC-2 family transporter protein [Micromonosporaceae bacterium]|nr:ABC-2 family transporter protein [Micromonosporaceae bacterium]
MVDAAEVAATRGAGARGERFRPYQRILRAQVRAQLSYRTSFWIDAVSGMTFTAMDLVTVLVLFNVTSVLGGFAFRDAFFMSAIASLSFSLADVVVGSIEQLRLIIRTGQLDSLLVRPLPLLPQLVSIDMQTRRVGRVLEGVAVLGVAAGLVHLRWSAQTVVMIIVTPIAGAALFAAIFVTTATVAFWWIDSGEFGSGFTYGGRDFTNYPMTVYGQFFRRVFAIGLGFAFIAYYPALTMLGRSDPLGLPDWAGWLSIPIAALACAVAGIVWRTGVRHYRSTGS